MKKQVKATIATVLTALLAAAPISAQYKNAKPAPSKWKEGFSSIAVEEAKDILTFLAGPDFRGRSPRTHDFAAAAGYVASYFRKLGLKPAGDEGSFFQRFKMESVSVLAETAKFESADGSLGLEYGKDYSLRPLEEVNASAQFVFFHLARDADPSQIDANLFEGKVVIISPESGRHHSAYIRGLIMSRAGRAAASRMPAIMPAKDGSLPVTTRPERVKGVPLMTSPRLPGFNMSESGAKKLAEKCGAQNYLAPAMAKSTIEICKIDFKIAAKVEARDSFETMNVVAKIEGADPILKEESVVIGAHLDHVGQTPQGMKYGADDNASGVTAALLIARAIMLNPVKPKRSVLIGLWSLEEGGLFGSWNYANRPVVPIEKTVAYLNMDMVGRNEQDRRFNETAEANVDSIYISAVKFNSPDLYALLNDANRFINLRLKDDVEDRVMRSDTASFYMKSVPTLKAFTGEHPDYHQAGDTPDKINYLKLSNVAKWLYLATMELGSRADRPRFEKTPFVPARAPATTNPVSSQ